MEQDSEGDYPPDGGGTSNYCCAEGTIRVELESRIVALEMKMEAREMETLERMTQLMECIKLRDEKLIAKDSELQENNKLLAEMQLKLNKSEEKFTELTETVNKLLKKLEEKEVRIATAEEGMNAKKKADRQQQLGTKPKQKKKITYRPASLEEIFLTRPFDKYFLVSVPSSKKRSLCPFKFEKTLSKEVGGTPVSISNGGVDKFIVEIKNENESEKMKKLRRIDDLDVKVEVYTVYNDTKGVFYIHNKDIEDTVSFKEGLMEEYNLKEVTEATWIKGKEGSKAFIITTCQAELPNYLHVTGEFSLTKVFPYFDSPLQCKTCQAYGHSKKYCSAETPICGRCTGEHLTTDCMCETEDDEKCANCQGQHRAGHRSCPEKKKEMKLVEIQKKMRVRRGEALRIFNGQPRNINEQREYSKYLEIKISSEKLNKVCPFKLEKFFKTKFNIKRDDIRTQKDHMIVKTTNHHQTSEMCKLKKIFEHSCEVVPYDEFNTSKGLVYITEYDIRNDKTFFEELKKRLDASEIQRADWTRTRNLTTTAFMITFKTTNPPAYINIPGEQKEIKVYEYLPKPYFCKQCLDYSHNKKHCTFSPRCAKCTGTHQTETCEAVNVKCLHCDGPHTAGDKACKRRRQEEEITLIKYKEKVNWPIAKQKYFMTHPDEQNEYAEKLKKTSQKYQQMLAQKKNQRELPLQASDHIISQNIQQDSVQHKQPEITPPNVPQTTEQQQRQATEGEAEETRASRIRTIGETSDEEPEGGSVKKGRMEEAGESETDAMEELNDSSETNEKIRDEVREIYQSFTH